MYVCIYIYVYINNNNTNNNQRGIWGPATIGYQPPFEPLSPPWELQTQVVGLTSPPKGPGGAYCYAVAPPAILLVRWLLRTYARE